jgi:ribonuclease HI
MAWFRVVRRSGSAFAGKNARTPGYGTLSQLPRGRVDIVAYTDGGCRGNPGVGAWAFALVDRATKRALERADAVGETTSHRMELTAVIEALTALRPPRRRVIVLSDSRYVVNCGAKWIGDWKRRGWKRKEGLLKNVDLLRPLPARLTGHSKSVR